MKIKLNRKSDAIKEADAHVERWPEAVGSVCPRPLNKFDLVFFIVTSLYILVMWGTGFNFLPLIATALAAAAGLLIFIRTLRGRAIGFWMWLAYIVAVAGTFVYFLIWSAEPFGKRLWWNLVLAIGPILLSVLAVFLKNVFKGRTLKLATACTAFLMIGTSAVYLVMMNLRVRPTVERMWEGHDAYLKSITPGSAAENSPNVLVILMDDMAYSDISSYSYLGSENATIQTPNIDSIAADGIMMENFYSASPVCSPSRFSMLTGRYSSRGYLDNVVFPTTVESTPYSPTHFINPYQFLNNVDGILGDEITFAEVLQRAGYNTGCIGKWNLGDYGEYLPTVQGFDYFYGSYYVNDMTPYNWVREVGGVAEEVRPHKENLDQSESTKLFTAELINFISASVESNEKFFAYYTSPWPHYPIFSGEKGDTSDDSYIHCIEEFDAYLGQVFDYLKEKGVYDDTLIVFTSDNGPGREGVTGALRGRKNTTFDGGMKVPLLASYKNGGLGSGDAIASTPLTIRGADGTVTHASTKVIEASSMNIDIFPTILDYVGISALPADRVIDGVSLKRLWQAEVASDFRVHSELYYLKKGKCQSVQMAVEVEGKVYDFKYYDNVMTENSAFIDQRYKNYLFNLDDDPAEGYNVSMTLPGVAAELKDKLLEFRREMKTNRRGIL